MKTRYKILILIGLSFIPISFFFPQVFLIFHLDKYETSENCDTLNGTWDWYSNKCVGMEYDYHDVNNLCVDLGGKKSCDSRCSDKWQWNYWNYIFPTACHNMCIDACDFTEEPEIWNSGEEPLKIDVCRGGCGNNTVTLQDTIFSNPPIFDPKLTDIVFDQHWIVYPGGAGPMPPTNSTLFKIYKEVTFGVSPLDLEAMLNDKIFVDKCELYGGVWDYTFSYCQLHEGIICEEIGGIAVMVDITPECTSICFDRGAFSTNSCVFKYNGE